MIIGGLPNRLSDEEFNECMKKFKETGYEEYREKLIAHNLRLVTYIVYEDFDLLNLEKEDMFSQGVIGLIKAIDNFDEKKGYSFATFATICIRNEILMYFRKEKKRLSNLSIHDLVYDKEGKEVDYNEFLADDNLEFEDSVADHDIFLALCKKIEKLNERDREIIKSYFGIGREKLNQKTISENLGLSQSYISRIINQCLSVMREEVRAEMGKSYSLVRTAK